MEDLFEGHNVGTARPLKLSEDVVSTATYGGPDKCYRYKLKRVWDPSRPLVMWLMMNPSVATEYGDDRTVAKCQRYARAWGYGGILVGNTFAYRCTDQLRLLETPDPVGPENDKALLEMAQEANKVIAAYGTPHHKALLARGPEVVHMLQQHGITVDALRLSKTGRPCHPLYLPASLLPEPLPTNLVQS
ncbi:hypothetical protein BJI49_07480 [Acetobacter pasteurianus]|uniref:Uncharacterized protein n=1 Tax=Acetobacter pasteurianus TaxID=438 RepID=A0A1A0DGT3_ACEPA|nr:DUF1643 domain-containing protein [Acetobacter pasteurianus]OAZ73892.1 hypothetical protein SRCM100623_00721 [Acetobacter pasteurianus]RCL07132.1 hypothetical protein BJI49_07480 [Acetobacter pasteurianus]GAB31157.1 hypothetical protein APS_1759 [Acetobacter pasteurianus subsp. pasteurianus LMG 1262 = NBRC 106471]GCD48798.1 hypothetical protein NBRC106471_0354 [Acetobacter pasteurianus subsp. pasteurianus LMG 1262 = NBRC 106471]